MYIHIYIYIYIYIYICVPGHVGKEALRVGVVLHEASEQGPELPQHKPFLTLHSRVELEDRSAQVLDRHDSRARLRDPHGLAVERALRLRHTVLRIWALARNGRAAKAWRRLWTGRATRVAAIRIVEKGRLREAEHTW